MRSSATTGLLLHLALLLASTARAQTDDERLARGEVLISTKAVEGFPLPQAEMRGVVDAPPEAVWAIIQDCGNYQRTMPRIAASTLEKREGNIVFCRVAADLPFPFSDLVSRTRAVHTAEPGKRYERAWEMIEGSDYTVNRGAFILVPFQGSGRTLVTYRVLAQPKVALPAFILQRAQQGALPDIIRRLRELTGKS